MGNEEDTDHRPGVGENNIWYRPASSGRVIVFVHGVLSESRTCWYDESTKAYWPKIVESDRRFSSFGIFLGGYYTATDAIRYDIRNSSDELLGAMTRIPEEGGDTVISNDEIVFVCHSTGGIVVRYLLVHHTDLFRDKKIGLVLIASPSLGSSWANWARILTERYGHSVIQQLEEDSWSLRDLDASFKRLREEKRIPGLCGIEAYENHFVIHGKWIPNKLVVVTEESAGRYFGPPTLLRKTDHFSTVKPKNKRGPAHELLVDFCQKHFLESSETSRTEALVEYVYADSVRLESYVSQIRPRPKQPLTQHEMIEAVLGVLSNKGRLLKARPDSSGFSEDAFVLESVTATKVIFPRKLTKENDLPQIAVWVAPPVEPPPMPSKDNEFFAKGTFLYLIEAKADTEARYVSMVSGRSALDMLLRELARQGSIQTSAADSYDARHNMSFPLATLKECGGLVQQPRQITTLYKPRSISDDQYVQVSGKILRCWDLYAYPIFISVS